MTTTGATITRLDPTNYAVWKLRVKGLLMQQKLWSLVEDGLPAAATAVQKASDQAAIGIICLHVSDQYVDVVMSQDSAMAAWEKLRTLFEGKSTMRKVQLRRQLQGLKMGATELLPSYFGRARQLRDELKAVGADVAEDEVVTIVLAGLPERFKAASTVLQLGFEDKLELDVAMAKLRPFEEGSDVATGGYEEDSATALYSKTRDRRCYICGSKKHLRARCPRREQEFARAYTAVAL